MQVGGDSINSRRSSMRKLDYLRKWYKKALKKGTDIIYYIDVPDAFYKKGDEGVWAHPYWDQYGLVGIRLEHDYLVSFEEGDQWFSWDEYFPMRKEHPFQWN